MIFHSIRNGELALFGTERGEAEAAAEQSRAL